MLAQADITCSRADVAAGSDPIGNPLGCETASNDELETVLASLELVAGYPARTPGGFEPFVAVGFHRLDGSFQVDARYRGVIDRTRLESDGGFWSAALGAGGTIAERWRLVGTLFYSPLEIRRPGESAAVEPVFNVRLGLARRLR